MVRNYFVMLLEMAFSFMSKYFSDIQGHLLKSKKERPRYERRSSDPQMLAMTDND